MIEMDIFTPLQFDLVGPDVKKIWTLCDTVTGFAQTCIQDVIFSFN